MRKPLICTQCQQPMQMLVLEGHYSQSIEVDLCTHCHWVWFDAFESVRLSGLGWVRLLRQMQAAVSQTTGPQQPMAKDTPDGAPLQPQTRCPRCDATLKPVRNLTIFGRFAALECPRAHGGHYQTFALLLAERGLVRPLSQADRQTLADEGRTLTCLNCGADASPAADTCLYCRSPLVVIDLPRLMRALLVRHAEALAPLSGSSGPVPTPSVPPLTAWRCHGCGASLDPTKDLRCDHCDHRVVVPSFVDLNPVLNVVEPLLLGRRPREARAWGERLQQTLSDYRATGLYRYVRRFLDK